MTTEGWIAAVHPRTYVRMLVVVAIGLLALGVYLWQLTVPGFLAYYDSGVYVAGSIHFVSGILPYRDFTFVNPPGILLLMSPVALLGRIFGSHDVFNVARVMTSIVTALNACLLAWLVRHRGLVAMAIAGVGLALLPVALFVSSDLKLDPYCICLVLLGVLVIFARDEGSGTISTRPIAVGGILFGLAALVKLWAFFPFLAMVICLIPRNRRRVPLVVGAAAVGFVVPSLPFILMAPRQFISQVFTVQLFGKVSPVGNPGVIWRLIDISGFSTTSIAPTAKEVVIAFSVLLLVIAIAYGRRMPYESVDAFLLITAAITVCGLLAAPTSATYYGYFAAPFLVGVFAVSVARLGEPALRLIDRLRVSSRIRILSVWILGGSGALLILAVTLYVTTFYTHETRFYGLYGPDISAVNKVIPAESCVVYNFVIEGVYSNRLQSNVPNCPNVIDPYGLWQTWGFQSAVPARAFVAEWKSFFENAQYVVFSSARAPYVPWDKSLIKWFAKNYRLVHSSAHVVIYDRDVG